MGEPLNSTILLTESPMTEFLNPKKKSTPSLCSPTIVEVLNRERIPAAAAPHLIHLCFPSFV